MEEELHKTEEIAIKTASVDVGILPLVYYLNSFSGIWTLWSCEGSNKKGEDGDYDLPYITFMAEDLASLEVLLQTIADLPCSVEVGYFSEFIPFRFSINFADKKSLEYCLSELNEKSVKDKGLRKHLEITDGRT